jgi:hypothetical protein
MASSHYVGKAGQLAVMAELAWRGYNVAIPEIDIGDDIFARDDQTGDLTRIQVKTATGQKLIRSGAYRCQFQIKVEHVSRQSSGSHYVLAGRCGGNWRYLIFKRPVLLKLLEEGVLGCKIGKTGYMATVIFYSRIEAATSTKRDAKDLSLYANRWGNWPKLPGGGPVE